MRFIKSVLIKAASEDMMRLGVLLKNKKTKDGGVIQSYSVTKGIHGPTLVLHINFKVEGHPYKQNVYVSKREEEADYRLEWQHNQHKVGTTPEAAAEAILLKLANPVKVLKKIGQYKGWDLFQTVKSGGYGGMAAKGDKWTATDVSYTRQPSNTESQLVIMIDNF